MPQFNVYLSQEEIEWVRRQPQGWLRSIVRLHMQVEGDEIPKEEEKTDWNDGKTRRLLCRHCGSPLINANRCARCGKGQL